MSPIEADSCLYIKNASNRLGSVRCAWCRKKPPFCLFDSRIATKKCLQYLIMFLSHRGPHKVFHFVFGKRSSKVPNCHQTAWDPLISFCPAQWSPNFFHLKRIESIKRGRFDPPARISAVHTAVESRGSDGGWRRREVARRGDHGWHGVVKGEITYLVSIHTPVLGNYYRNSSRNECTSGLHPLFHTQWW